jgi:hypothetical protein
VLVIALLNALYPQLQVLNLNDKVQLEKNITLTQNLHMIISTVARAHTHRAMAEDGSNRDRHMNTNEYLSIIIFRQY